MIDLHCHMLPGLDDGACNLEISLEMARMAVADGITVVACTPHIRPGLYHNTGAQILAATDRLRNALQESGIDLQLICGADAHMTVRFTDKLAKREIPTLGGSRYVLVEPPHHVAPIRLEQFFFEILIAELEDVTPAMLDAGLDCFYDLPELLGPTEQELRQALKRAFIRMRQVQPR